VAGIPPAQIIPYLNEIGYPADLQEVSQAIIGLFPRAQLHLALDICEGIGDKIGFECKLDGESYRGQAEREAAFLDYLQLINCCTPQQKEALLRYPGFMDFRTTAKNRLECLKDDGGESHSGLIRTIRRDISHIKLTFQPGKPISAKAYLRAVYDWLSQLEAMRNELIYLARTKEYAHQLSKQPTVAVKEKIV